MKIRNMIKEETINEKIVMPKDFNKDEMEDVRDFVSTFITNIWNVSKGVSKRTGKNTNLKIAKILAASFIPRNDRRNR